MDLKDLPAAARPREKLLAHGPAALADAELLALLLRTGLKGKGVLALATELGAQQADGATRPAGARDGRAAASRARAEKAAFLAPLAASTERPIRPERVLDALNRLLPARAIAVADPGTPCPYFSAYFQAPEAGRHFIDRKSTRLNSSHVALSRMPSSA